MKKYYVSRKRESDSVLVGCCVWENSAAEAVKRYAEEHANFDIKEKGRLFSAEIYCESAERDGMEWSRWQVAVRVYFEAVPVLSGSEGGAL